ncbi:acyl-CoA synthetase FdrA [Candidatus Dependentiae bacterium]|nr:acyl-CoA synthetase FdrA [Candidatus Dependentiae bacterium]
MIKNYIIKNRYFDSVMLMSIANSASKCEGIKNLAAMMATDNNKEVLRNTKMIDKTGEKAEPNDLLVCINAEAESFCEPALKKFKELLDNKSSAENKSDKIELTSIADGIKEYADSNLVLFSIPGPFVKREAKTALSAGKNVMIFSDNVTIDEELELKQIAKQNGLIVMGPDCGTSIINGKGIAFANSMPIGKIGIIGASGTGIQQVSCILANKGYGVKHAIGLGGRDLSKQIGGISMLTAIDAMEKDIDIEIVILISKPPFPEVEKKIFDRLKNYKKKIVVNFLKGDETECKKRRIPFASTLENAANLAISILENKPFEPKEFDAEKKEIDQLLKSIRNKTGSSKYVRGLYSGGTLCDEALFIMAQYGLEVFSNIPLTPELKLKNAYESYKNTLVDLGDDEFTKGRPHPMIDYTLRCQRIVEESSKKDTGIILFDIVTGYGSHINPVEPLSEAITKSLKNNKNLVFIASICGTSYDIQNINEIKKQLEKLGVIFMPTNAQAAKLTVLALKGKVVAL